MGGVHQMDMSVVNFAILPWYPLDGRTTLRPIDLWLKILWLSLDWGDWRYGHFKEGNSPLSASTGWRSCPQIQPVCGGREKKFRHRGNIFSPALNVFVSAVIFSLLLIYIADYIRKRTPEKLQTVTCQNRFHTVVITVEWNPPTSQEYRDH